VRLKDAVVIVTGAGSGIGLESAKQFAREGAKTVVADIEPERLDDAVREIESLGGETVAVPTDVSNRHEVDRLIQTAIDRFGRVDILVNNAGYGYGATIEQTSEEEFERLWETNVLSVLFGMQAVLPIMREQRSGHIINVASAAGKIGYPGIGAYSATKHAIVALTEALRGEITGTGIHTSTVLPVGTRTRFFDEARLEQGGSVGPHFSVVQSAEHVAKKIVDCAKHPVSEVLPYKPLRLGIAIHGVVPAIIDAFGRRSFRKQVSELGEPTRIPAHKEAPHGEPGR